MHLDKGLLRRRYTLPIESHSLFTLDNHPRTNTSQILNAVTTLAENNINITNFIIDDNWQSIDYRGHGQFQHGWVEFEAERNAFPQGLKHMVQSIREKHPSIQHVAVWHAILGYWGGLSPDGKLANSYKTVEVVRVSKTFATHLLFVSVLRT
jgi:hypothetical protein